MEGRTATETSGRDESDLDVVFRRGEWHSWHEAIEWLRTDGMDDSEISPEHARSLIASLGRLERERMAFTADPRLAAQLLRSRQIAHC